MAATFQWHSEGRLLLNVVTGGEAHEQKAYGDHLDKESRYARCSEFLEVVNRLWREEAPVSFTGEHFQIEEATIPRKPEPLPPLYFGGSSPPAGPVAADHCDVYLTWGEPPQAVAEKLRWIRGLVAERKRQMRYGIRLHVIARDTADEAWAAADKMLAGVSDETIAKVQANLRRSESEGQRRMLDLHGGSTRDLVVAPNLWAGVGLARGGAGTALVGSHIEVADRIEEYADLGLSEFVLSGYPHLEEAYWFGEGVLPLLAKRGLWTHPLDRVAAGDPSERRTDKSQVPFAAA
jgi:alkanesulfonate monooxygenase